jgi:hypothetical protein
MGYLFTRRQLYDRVWAAPILKRGRLVSPSLARRTEAWRRWLIGRDPASKVGVRICCL